MALVRSQRWLDEFPNIGSVLVLGNKMLKYNVYKCPDIEKLVGKEQCQAVYGSYFMLNIKCKP
jgi:hypothetical protein